MGDSVRRRLVRHGLLLFLLGLVTGFAIPAFLNPRAGLAAHLEGVMNGTFLIALGAAWGELHLPARAARATYGLALFGTYANWFATGLGAVLGTSKFTPIAGAGFTGAALAENLVGALLVSVGLAMVACLSLAVWGAFRRAPEAAPAR